MLTTFTNIFTSAIDKHAPLKTKKIRRNQALTKHQLNCYCPVAIMKKFAQIMLHFHLSQTSLPTGQYFPVYIYSPPSRKLVALFANISKREREK